MTRHRALAAAVGLVLALAGGTGAAAAAWQVSNTGTSTARAGTLAAPTNVTAGTPACNGTTATARFTWTAPAGAVSYQLEIATNDTFTQGLQSGSTANTFATASQQNARTRSTLYFRTRAVAGTWISANSAVVSATIGPCT